MVGIGEGHPDDVPLAAGERLVVGEHQPGGAVPGDDRPSVRRRVRGVRQCVEHRLEPGVNHRRGIHRVGRRMAAGQDEEMAMLGRIEPEHPAQAVQHRLRRPHRPALLEPGVPGQAHPRELCHLLAPQAGRPPPPPRRKPCIGGPEPLATRPKELGQLREPIARRSSCPAPKVAVFIPG